MSNDHSKLITQSINSFMTGFYKGQIARSLQENNIEKAKLASELLKEEYERQEVKS